MTDLQVVTKEKLADTETPVSAFLKLCQDQPDSFLLESAEEHENIGRYSIIAFDPLARLELWPDKVLVSNRTGPSSRPAHEFFDLIRQILKDHDLAVPKGLPSVGSLMGFIGYDAVRLIEKLGPPRTTDLPTARLAFPSRFVIFDHRRRIMVLVALDEDLETAEKKIAATEALFESGRPDCQRSVCLDMDHTGPERYTASIDKAKNYIREGEIFQVVLADRFEGRTNVHPMEVYRRLRVKSPSPYMFFLNFGDYQILGASPETLVKVKGDKVVLRPIAGTRGRSDDPAKDRLLEQELRESEKECAEHIMLVDLGRNDAGRVAKYGTVQVEPYMKVERYSHVMHLVSQVQGVLHPGADAVDAFMAGFPAGTVSGAPKVRAMQIIDELEYWPRGPYSGAVGYFGQQNEMDTCIAIRMILFQGGRFTIPVGAGIVADSIPKMEFKEIQHKAAQSIAALQAAAEGVL